jgi:hypothetical protein
MEAKKKQIFPSTPAANSHNYFSALIFFISLLSPHKKTTATAKKHSPEHIKIMLCLSHA